MPNYTNVTINNIKEDRTQKGGLFFKVFFNEVMFNDDQEKVFFVWPDTQAYEMFKEKVFKTGDRVNIDYFENEGYYNLTKISRYVSENDASPERRKYSQDSTDPRKWN